VLLVTFVILLSLIIVFSWGVHIPADVKIGYCVVTLAAGALFASMITCIAKGDHAMVRIMLRRLACNSS
jgi:bile acid:Na+ symporter, BASS family